MKHHHIESYLFTGTLAKQNRNNNLLLGTMRQCFSVFTMSPMKAIHNIL